MAVYQTELQQPTTASQPARVMVTVFHSVAVVQIGGKLVENKPYDELDKVFDSYKSMTALKLKF